MGILRLFLALSVLFQHSGMQWGLGGGRAVEIFFVISGFYMSLILTTGKYRDYKTFLINRLLRLYPIYIVIALMTVTLAVIFNIPPAPQYISYGNELSPLTLFYVCFTNLTLIGQDLSVFLGIQDGHLFGTLDFTQTNPKVFGFLLIPQAWSLSLELMFYAIAPLILWQQRRKKLAALFVLCFLSMLCQLALSLFHLNYDPWCYRFFPSILYLFLLGSLAHHFYESHLCRMFQNFNRQQLVMLGCAVTLLGIIYKLLGACTNSNMIRYLFESPTLQASAYIIVNSLKVFAHHLGFVFVICYLFYVTSIISWDRMIGELSYPVYVVHILIINILSTLMPQGNLFSLVVAGLSILLSIGLIKWVQNPIDQYRTFRLQKNTPSPDVNLNRFELPKLNTYENKSPEIA
jgi:peptidoglycan/LPS O-acetylase OafA/YrhL